MSKERFTVIKGGRDYPPHITDMHFAGAFATDTRLMGVVGLYIKWEVERYEIPEVLHQFFYLDAEEYGFENYISAYNADDEKLNLIERNLMGGLGGKHVELSLRECKCLLSDFADMNRRLGLDFPENYEEYSFLIENTCDFSESERDALNAKICTEIQSYFHVTHYFLMRIFGRDYSAAEYVSKGESDKPCEVDVHLFDEIPAGTLCKNTIDIDFSSEKNTLLCESLIELDNHYMVAVSRITFSDDFHYRVESFERINLFRISSVEAAMQLARSEYVTVYSLRVDPGTFEARAGSLMNTAMKSYYDRGTLYMIYNPHNNHVNKRVFLINNDVRGIIYLSNSSEMLLVSYDIFTISELERQIAKSDLRTHALVTNKFEFKESVIYDYIQSGFESFTDFIEYIQDPGSDDGE
ncbi:MAG: hypothetical protein IJP24_02125 [Firmicutes bacterium]|nr:hypothetical protein [Bacillota bacterium]